MKAPQPVRQEKKIFSRRDFSGVLPTNGYYEECQFNDCNFYKGNLSNVNFLECEFNRCDMSVATVKNTGLRDIVFRECKLSGVRFDQCGTLISSLRFDTCILDLASFNKLRIRKTIFKDCSLHETDFSDADLTEAVFDHCDLDRSLFHHTIVERGDFRTSYNFSIDPEINRVKKALFSPGGIQGLLRKYDILIE